MRLTVIGCSGSFPGPTSAASCYLVEADEQVGDASRTWRVLLDLGSGALGPLQRVVHPHQVDGVALSHLHADHCLDLCGMYVALKYHPDGPLRRRLPVIGPSATHDRLAQAYGLDPETGMSGELEISTWTLGQPTQFGPIRITPYPVEHPIEAYALRVEGPSQRAGERAVLTYSGDTDTCDGLVEAARGADVLLAEAAFQEGRDVARGVHLTGRRAAQIAVETGVGRLVLTHLPPWNDPQVAVNDARRVWGGPLDLAQEGLVVTL